MGRYLPGYKDGGPIRTIKNLTDYLGKEFDFKILTCDRDHGDVNPYAGIKVNDWNRSGNADVYYVVPGGFKWLTILKLVEKVDLVYVCGCFNDYAIKILLAKWIGKIKKPVVIAAMGLFSPNAFKIKYVKKKLYITILNLGGIFKNIYWSATSEEEVTDILQQVRARRENFFIAEDLPRVVESNSIIKEKKEVLKVVWISRISGKKNLLGAIRILKNVKEKISFTIYGPIHEKNYWEMCKEELAKLPKNIMWEYKGSIENELVINTLKRYHVFLFPTLGENYGHVIQEALAAGCACILSDQTPWKNLEKKGVGYVFKLSEMYKFSDAIEKYARMSGIELQKVTNKALEYAIENSNYKVENTGYRDLFNTILNFQDGVEQ